MTKRMAACALSTLDRWVDQVAETNDQCKEIEVHKEFMELTADIIAHTSFGTSYKEGKEVFEVERKLHRMVIDSVADVYIPGNISQQNGIDLEKRLRNKLKSIIESKLRTENLGDSNHDNGEDLLGLIMGISEDSKKQ